MALNRLNRREFLWAAGAAALARGAWTDPARADGPALTAPEKVSRQIEAYRPLAGAVVPADMGRRLGATHYAGLYHLSDEPYLIEGCKQISKLGMGVVKLYLDRRLPGYSYNSDWKLPADATLVDVAKHPYFQAAFSMPFNAIVLQVQHVGRYKGGWRSRTADFSEDRKQVHELAAYLLRTYRDRGVRFIIQHWEGDWMLRDSAGQMWDEAKDRPANIEERCDAMVRWLSARQEGVEQARREAANGRCRVEHGAEVNRVLDGLKGIPTVITHVLPKVAVDWVSWSCYDGMGAPADLWNGIEVIRHYARPVPGMKRRRVYIGEVGLPERERDAGKVVEFWDQAIGVFVAKEIPYIIHWELYCNEPTDRKPEDRRVRKAEELRGFWLIRPDGSLSNSGAYLKSTIESAGRRLPMVVAPKD